MSRWWSSLACMQHSIDSRGPTASVQPLAGMYHVDRSGGRFCHFWMSKSPRSSGSAARCVGPPLVLKTVSARLEARLPSLQDVSEASSCLFPSLDFLYTYDISCRLPSVTAGGTSGRASWTTTRLRARQNGTHGWHPDHARLLHLLA